MRPSSHLRLLCMVHFFASFIAMSDGLLRAQQVFTWNGTTGGDWFASANWNPSSGIPDTTGDVAVFQSTPLTQLTWSGTITLGGLTFNGTATGNLDLGNASASDDILQLEQTGGLTPVITVSSGRPLSIYANLEGTQGFTKNGSGTLSFRYNPADMNLSGDIRLNGGTVVIDRAGSLGSGSIIFTASSTLTSTPDINSPSVVTHLANRTFTLNSGVTATFSNGNANAQTVFDGVISGAGNLLFNGANGNFTLKNTNSYTGSTTLNSAKLFLVGSNLSTGNLVLSGNNSLLNLGGSAQTIANLSLPSTGSTALLSTATNGTMTISGGFDQTFVGRPHGSVTDLSGLASFQSTNALRDFNVLTTIGNATNTLRLSSQSNVITANSTNLGGASSASGSLNVVNVELGQSNTFQTSTLRVGGSNSTANLIFQSGVANGSLRLRGTDGSNPVTTWIIGDTSNSGVSGQASVNLTGGTLDAAVGTLVIGRHSASGSNSETSSFTMSGGNFSATNIVLAEKTNAASPVLTSMINQSGGNVEVGNLTFGQGGTAAATLFPSYNLSSGVLSASVVAAGSNGSFSGNTSRNLNISGNATFRNISGRDLTIQGLVNSPSGWMNVNVTQNATFQASGGGVLFGSNSSLNGNGTIMKTGTGALVFSSASANHTFAGLLKMLEGNLTVDGSLALATVELTAGSLTGNGTIGTLKLGQPTPLNLSGGQLSIQALEGGSDLSKTGAGALLIGNTAGFSGNISVTQGALLVDSSSSVSILVNSATLGGNGTLSNVSLSGTSSFDVSANKSLFISSPISGGLGFSKNGSGSLTLSNTTGHSGNVTVNAGALYFSSSSNANISVNSAILGGNATLQSVSLSGASVFNISNGETLLIQSALSGSSGFSKNGTGTLSIGGGVATGLSGPITLNSGVLRTLSTLTSNLAIGSATISGNATLGNLTISSGASAVIDAGVDQVLTLSEGATIAGNGNFSKTGEGSFSIAGSATHSFNGTATVLSGNLIFSGNLSRSNLVLDGGGVSGNGTLGSISILRNSTFSTATGLTMNGTLSGAADLFKNGAGNLTISNASGFTGSLAVLQGGLYVNSNSSASVSLSSATLGGNGVLQVVSSSGSSTLDVAASRSLSINSSLTGSGSFLKTGAGNLTINNATGYSGSGQAVAGGIVLNSAFNQSLSLSNATLGGNSTIHSLAIQGNSTVQTTQNITISNAITGASRLTKTGTGALIFNAGVTSGFSGPLTLNQGILRTFSNLSSSITLAGGTLSGNAIVSGTTSITTNGSVFDVSSGQTLSINGSSARFTGNRNFSKTGSGIFTIQTPATHSYSGIATVVAGSFIVSTGANLTSSTIVVDGTTAALGGGGRLNALTLNSGKIAPSVAAAAGTFTTLNASSLTWNSGTVSLRLGDALSLTSSDRITLSGSLIKGSGSQFIFDFEGGGFSGGAYTLFGFGSNAGFSASDFMAINLGNGLSSTFSMSSNNLVLNVVPEPAAYSLVAVCGLIFIFFRILKLRSRIQSAG